MKHSPQSLADMLERDYFPPNSSLGKNLYLAYDEWRMVIDALRAQRAEGFTTVSAGGQNRMNMGMGAARVFTIHVDPTLPDDVAEIRAYPDGPVLCKIINLAAV